jgi:hypothetical protein
MAPTASLNRDRADAPSTDECSAIANGRIFVEIGCANALTSARLKRAFGFVIRTIAEMRCFPGVLLALMSLEKRKFFPRRIQPIVACLYYTRQDAHFSAKSDRRRFATDARQPIDCPAPTLSTSCSRLGQVLSRLTRIGGDGATIVIRYFGGWRIITNLPHSERFIKRDKARLTLPFSCPSWPCAHAPSWSCPRPYHQ